MTDDAPKYTVSGNHIRFTRLDPEGQPVGEPIEMHGPVSFDIDADKVEDSHFDALTNTFTMDLTFNAVDPDLLALLTGQGTAPERLTVVDGRTRWQRFMDNHPRLDFTLFCVRRWTLDLVVDGYLVIKRWLR